MGWLSGYTYRKLITLSRASGAVTNYQMKLLVGKSSGATGEDVDCADHCQDDFDDLRFTTSDGTTLLDYWIESSGASGTSYLATVWIEFNSIGTGATTFYMYYGKADATAASNGTNTFITFDDFESGSNGNDFSSPWSLVQGSTKYSTAQKYKGSNSGKWAGGATFARASLAQTATANYSIQYRVYKLDATNHADIYHGNGTKFANVDIDSSEKVYYNDGSTHDTGKTITADAWNIIELNNFNWSAYTFDIYVNGALAKSGATMYTSSSVANLIYFDNQDTTSNHDAYFDNIIIRQWASTEPAWGSWGVENQNVDNTCTDGLTIGDSTTGSLSIFQALTDGLTLGDSTLIFRAFYEALTDGLILGDIAIHTYQTNPSLTDGLTLGDSASNIANLFNSLTDGLSLGDSTSPVGAIDISVTDGLILGDTAISHAHIIFLSPSYAPDTRLANRIYVIGTDANGNMVFGEASAVVNKQKLKFYPETIITNQADAAAIAANLLSYIRLATPRGNIRVVPNVGTELWDVISITDSNDNQTPAITRRVSGWTTTLDTRNGTYEQTIKFTNV